MLFSSTQSVSSMHCYVFGKKLHKYIYNFVFSFSFMMSVFYSKVMYGLPSSPSSVSAGMMLSLQGRCRGSPLPDSSTCSPNTQVSPCVCNKTDLITGADRSSFMIKNKMMSVKEDVTVAIITWRKYEDIPYVECRIGHICI